MIPAEVNSKSGPSLSDTLFAPIGDYGWRALGWRLGSSSVGDAYTVTSSSFGTLFEGIGNDAVIQRFSETNDWAMVPAFPHSR